MRPAAAKRWFIYALGGGFGHLTRALALARGALADGHHVEILANSPLATPQTPASRWCAGITISKLDPRCDRPAVTRCVHDVFARIEPDVLIVDTFPRGLGGELASELDRFRCPKVLVHRDLNPRYVERFRLQEWTAKHYDLLLLPGEDGCFAQQVKAVRTAPWLLLNHDELLRPGDARRRLDATGSRPVVAVVSSGRPEESRQLERVAGRLLARTDLDAEVRLISLSSGAETALRPSNIWPLLEVMAGIDVLVGAGGYNTVYEARATETPLVAFAFRRLYDRQYVRLCANERVVDDEQVIERVVELVDRRAGAATTRSLAPYVNGKAEAVRLIEVLIRSHTRAD